MATLNSVFSGISATQRNIEYQCDTQVSLPISLPESAGSASWALVLPEIQNRSVVEGTGFAHGSSSIDAHDE
jgi:hypothetical protein